MGFEELHLQDDYKSSRDDVVNEFFIPVLSKAKIYKRAVGFFSSSALYEISRGLTKLAENDGKMQLIVSPRLSIEDIETINDGYEQRVIVSTR